MMMTMMMTVFGLNTKVVYLKINIFIFKKGTTTTRDAIKKYK